LHAIPETLADRQVTLHRKAALVAIAKRRVARSIDSQGGAGEVAQRDRPDQARRGRQVFGLGPRDRDAHGPQAVEIERIAERADGRLRLVAKSSRHICAGDRAVSAEGVARRGDPFVRHVELRIGVADLSKIGRRPVPLNAERYVLRLALEAQRGTRSKLTVAAATGERTADDAEVPNEHVTGHTHVGEARPRFTTQLAGPLIGNTVAIRTRTGPRA